MTKGRLEAFSDGVVAILITIMVLELKIGGHDAGEVAASFAALHGIGTQFLAYVLSFVFLGIYWNNHHHMLHMADRVNGAILWANLHLLFWLSLVPTTTAWIGDTHFAPAPLAAYGVVLLCAAIAYTVLQRAIIRTQGEGSRLAAAVGRDRKGLLSMAAYVAAIPLAFVHAGIAGGLYIVVALIWLVPDRRIESKLPH
ncbi:MAG TPA: TMEM175 family protein [Planctomycetota bacterium]|nr:TMEM175 family protein [Planctomycetota bacterium]